MKYDTNKTAKSGEKFATEQGFTAIKNGIKNSAKVAAEIERKPSWLRVRPGTGVRYQEVKKIVSEHKLATVCAESHCPNISECWNHGTATYHAYGRNLHSRLPFLRRRHRQSSRLARSQRTSKRG
jgi:lipoic acid synthetase